MLANLACDRYGAICIPGAAPLKWGRLHHFALCAMRFALAELSFRTLTIVDSDQLALRRGYSAYVSNYLGSRNRVGMLVNSPGRQTVRTQAAPRAQRCVNWTSGVRFSNALPVARANSLTGGFGR